MCDCVYERVSDRSLVKFFYPSNRNRRILRSLNIASRAYRSKKSAIFEAFREPNLTSVSIPNPRNLDVVVLKIVAKKKQVHGQTHRQHIHITNLEKPSHEEFAIGIRNLCVYKQTKQKVCRISAQSPVDRRTVECFYTYILHQVKV